MVSVFSVVKVCGGSPRRAQGTKRGGKGVYPQMAQMAQMFTTEDTEREKGDFTTTVATVAKGELFRASLPLLSLL